MPGIRITIISTPKISKPEWWALNLSLVKVIWRLVLSPEDNQHLHKCVPITLWMNNYQLKGRSLGPDSFPTWWDMALLGKATPSNPKDGIRQERSCCVGIRDASWENIKWDLWTLLTLKYRNSLNTVHVTTNSRKNILMRPGIRPIDSLLSFKNSFTQKHIWRSYLPSNEKNRSLERATALQSYAACTLTDQYIIKLYTRILLITWPNQLQLALLLRSQTWAIKTLYLNVLKY